MKTLFWLMLLLSGDAFSEGMRAYQEGRFKDALSAFSEAEKRAGNGASAELLHDKALAALRAGNLSEAESSAEKAAARGGPPFAAMRDFLLGNVAFTRCEGAEAVANRVEAEPFAFDAAIALAETARSFWQLAAASRPDWPEARRNVERALLKLEALKKKKDEAEKKRKKDPDSSTKNPDRPDSRPPLPGEREKDERVKESEANPMAEPQKVDLPPEQVLRLLDKVNEKEREKLRLRRDQKRVQPADVEKDW